MRSGSRAYGTHRPDSDHDYRGVAVPPIEYRDGFLHHFEQADISEPDATIFDLRKFMKLAADANPNILEVLWVEGDDVLVATQAGRRLLGNRERFLSKKALHTFRGYAMSQLKRIRRHRHWLLHPPTGEPSRKDFGLSEHTDIPEEQLKAASSAVEKRMESWDIDFGSLEPAEKIRVQEEIESYLVDLSIGADERFRAAARLLGYEENFIDLLERERSYQKARREWRQYNQWKANRNPARAILEERHGYDLKHAMHLVRLLRMCREILEEGRLQVRRPDADELRTILEGGWSYDGLMEWAARQDEELLAVAETSPLPDAPDRKALNELCIEITDMLPPRHSLRREEPSRLSSSKRERSLRASMG